MATPGFTAEASLGRIRDYDVLTSGTAAEAGRVLPAFQCEPGVCVCRGGENSADCQNLKLLCGAENWVGCDGLGRCFCSVPGIYLRA